LSAYLSKPKNEANEINVGKLNNGCLKKLRWLWASHNDWSFSNGFVKTCVSIISPYWLDWKRLLSQYVPKFYETDSSS